MKLLLRAVTVMLGLSVATARAEVSEIRISYQPSIIYLSIHVMTAEKMIEAQGKALGLNLTPKFQLVSSGGVANDALLSGNLDVATTGPSNLLLLWDRTKGQVKAFASSSATPMWLVTRNPNVKTLADLGPADKIALPTVKISSQAILLQMAARKAFGDAGFDKLDTYTTSLGHPEAAAALSNLGGAVNAHFSAPPFQQAEAKLSGARVLTTSTEILGGPVSNAIHYGTVKFHDANPTVVKAFLAAVEEANKFIAERPREACEIYVAATGEKAPVDDLVKLIQEPGMIYSSTPYGMMKFATHMSDVKVLRMRAEKWQDFFFPEVHALKGD